MIRTYAAWTRRQASAMTCGGGAVAAVLLVLGAVVWALALAAERYWTVICETFWLTAGAAAGAALTWLVLALGAARHRRWLRSRCETCRTAAAIAVIRFANGLRSDTAALCGPCWKAAERACTAHAGLGSSWETARPAHGLPVVSEERAVPEPAGPAGQVIPASGGAWGMNPAAEAAAIRGQLAAAPDNEPAGDQHTAAELARVLEQAAPSRPGLVPPERWTRQHP